MIDDSASGESSTRPGYFFASPSVARNTPPASTSSPRMNTRSSFPISSSSVERIASMTVTSAISQLLVDEAERVLWRRVRLHQSPLRRFPDFALDPRLDLVQVVGRE